MKLMAIASLLFLTLGSAYAQENSVWYNNATLRQQLDTSATSFFAGEKGNFVKLEGHYSPDVDKNLLATQFLGVFDGVPSDQQTTKHGYTIYSGCQPQNCGVSAAILTEPNSTLIDAAALIHWRCARKDLPMDSEAANKGGRFRVGGCDDRGHPTVTIFFAHKGTVDHQMIRDLKMWAKTRLHDIGVHGKAHLVVVAFK